MCAQLWHFPRFTVNFSFYELGFKKNYRICVNLAFYESGSRKIADLVLVFLFLNWASRKIEDLYESEFALNICFVVESH